MLVTFSRDPDLQVTFSVMVMDLHELFQELTPAPSETGSGLWKKVDWGGALRPWPKNSSNWCVQIRLASDLCLMRELLWASGWLATHRTKLHRKSLVALTQLPSSDRWNLKADIRCLSVVPFQPLRRHLLHWLINFEVEMSINFQDSVHFRIRVQLL